MGGMTKAGEAEARRQIARIVAAVDFPARDRAVVEGVGGEVAVAGAEGPVAGLAQALYGRFYCVPQPGSAGPGDPAAFLAALRSANRVARRFEDGWTVARIDPSGILLAGATGRQQLAALADILPYGGGVAPGQPVRLASPRETVTGPGGHYVIFGRPIRDARAGGQVRFYWNFGPEAAAPFLAAIGAGLERRRIPFQAKVPVSPAGYGRSDCGVLYLNCEDVEAALDIVAGTRLGLGPAMRPDTPLFTRRLAPGLAFAESPPGAESFGMHRCRLVAEGLVTAFQRGATEPQARADSVCERLTGYGLDLAALERNAATRYPYRFEALEAA
jgi:hypothetical protein